MKKLLLLLAAASFTTFAQISITSNDVSGMFAVGNFATIHEYDGAQIDIGSPGGSNNWDFTGLQTNSTFTYESVNPGSTLYISEFPNANIALHSQRVYIGEPGDGYSYLEVTGNLLNNIGQAVVFNSQPGNLYIVNNNPPDALILPITYNNGYQEHFFQTIYLNGSSISQDSVFKDVLIDAWGTMTLPGGENFEALRIKEVRSVNGVPEGAHYSFQSSNGAQVNMQASDPNAPDFGIIDIDWYDWNLPFITDVEQITGLLQDFSMRQNYPNPFNPTTNIEYAIPEASFVQLKVYDILGNEVASLVNEEQSAGTYRVVFKANNLASGLYIAKLQAGNYSKTIKMTLMK
jgi:hypothetical protein